MLRGPPSPESSSRESDFTGADQRREVMAAQSAMAAVTFEGCVSAEDQWDSDGVRTAVGAAGRLVASKAASDVVAPSKAGLARVRNRLGATLLSRAKAMLMC